ncbi:carbamoyltransferase family protein [Thermoflavifilum thermophilum]|uniref:Carbamoyltransferase n=1 Tax=Thermoflavifilum thermophilum TaxID=1393122 RepID=A0A1I7N9L5_9BACT|nr:carbamoyltransferase C-terminal domain-containing protein [Thermoflavifilum thermophilum]SFV31337.1 carbamoyltransferase [Thermoflavifilum thermophilum]
MYILGINAFHGDSAACLVKDGILLNAVEEERIRRIKHWAGFPEEAIRFCLQDAGISIQDVDYITIGRNPSAHLLKKAAGALFRWPDRQYLQDRLYNMRQVVSVKTHIARMFQLPEARLRPQIRHIEHHRSHLASAFYASPFEEAALISIDGFGDYTSVMMGVGRGREIRVLQSITYPHSLGIFYTAFTQFLGFPHYGDEYKVMGLAPYGEPRLIPVLRRVIKPLPHGRFVLQTAYFGHTRTGVKMTRNNGAPTLGCLYTEALEALLSPYGKPRRPDEPIQAFHRDLAASVQQMTEDIIFHLLRDLYHRTHIKNLCVAGGVAQNSVAMGKIRLMTDFENIYLPPAAYDAGTSFGSALWCYHQQLQQNHRAYVRSASLGPQFSDDQIEAFLQKRQIPYQRMQDKDQTVAVTAHWLAEGKVVGWFQGRTEFGPRALGNRSVLVHPGRPDAKELLNSKIKRRESFRPFAPSILKEYVPEYFEQDDDVYFMEKVFRIKPEKRALIPAVTHVDGTGRLQTVHRDVAPLYYALIDKFRQITGLPILLNTSFNENEPIVNAPEQALDCFLRTEMDALVMGNCVVARENLH